MGEGRRYRERQAIGGRERRDKVVREGTQTQGEINRKTREGKKWLWNTFFLNLKRASGKVVKAALFSTILTRFP